MMNNGIKSYDRQDSGKATHAIRESLNDSRIIDEEALIKRTFDHDRQAGGEILFQKYYGILCSHAVRLVYSREVAEDIVPGSVCKFLSDRIRDRQVSTQLSGCMLMEAMALLKNKNYLE